MMEREILAQIARSVVDCDVDRTKELARRALEEGLDPLEAIEEGLARGIRSVGDSFARGEAFLPDLMMAAEAMKAGLSVLEGAVKERGLRRRALGKVVIGTVEGDLHDIGKSIVVTMLEANGFEVLDLGVDVPCRRFVEAVKEERPDVLGLSALLTSTLPRQREVIEALEREGLRDRVKVMVGGAPVTRSWADEIGADAYGEDAIDAVAKARRLLGPPGARSRP